MNRWEKQLETYESLMKEILEKREKEKSGLRFNSSFIIASDIAEQFFCEKKVEMRYVHGDVETEAKTIGTEAHEKLLQDSVKIKREELWQEIYGKEQIFALEMHLLAKHKEVVLAGRPDSVLFQNGYPLIVFEYKFTKSTTAYMTYHVQARTYGILLRDMGFDISRLFYAIVLADPKVRNDKHLKQKVVNAVINNGPKEAALKIKNVIIYLHKFNQNDAGKDLDWAIEFWKNSREATPTNNSNKCKNCEYKVECEPKKTWFLGSE
jgi:CRISPR/Cas system-associated exonuclease Cas4 (RecB family)